MKSLVGLNQKPLDMQYRASRIAPLQYTICWSGKRLNLNIWSIRSILGGSCLRKSIDPAVISPDNMQTISLGKGGATACSLLSWPGQSGNECSCNIGGLKCPLVAINREMDNSGMRYSPGCHGMVELDDHLGVEVSARGHKRLQGVLLHKPHGISKLRICNKS